MLKLAVLVSGTSSILEAMVIANLPIELVVADRPCRGLEIAEKARIPNKLHSRVFGKSFERREYTLDMVKILKQHGIGLVAMAGFMTVFDSIIFSHYQDRIINIHPSLLPAFKGDHAVADALKFGVKVTGTTIHFATPELDNGAIIAQEAVPVLAGDTVETLHERIKVVERRLYPETIFRLLKTLY